MSSILARNLDIVTLYDKPVFQEDKITAGPRTPARELAENWIGQFDKAIRTKNSAAVVSLFQDDGGQIQIQRSF